MEPQLAVLVSSMVIAVATALTPPAAAQQDTAEKALPGARLIHLDRFVPSGVEQKVLFVTAVTPDCVPTGTFTPKFLARPQHGTLTFSDAEDFSTWNAPNPREKCNDKKLRGIRISYKSDPDYTGQDKTSLLVITPDSFAFQYEISIDVR